MSHISTLMGNIRERVLDGDSAISQGTKSFSYYRGINIG